MSDIIRRNKAVPLKARRVETQPEMIQIPGADAMPLPHMPGPTAGGITQNIIYVNVPAGHSAPQPAPAPPGEVHVHTHVHNYPRRRSGHGTSFLGTMGLVVGGVACGMSQIPQLVWLAQPTAMVGIGCAAFGLLGAVLFRRVGSVMPLIGLIASAVGYFLWMVSSGQSNIALPKAIRDAMQPQAANSVGSGESGNAPGTATTPKATPPSVDRTKVHDRSIFGEGGKWGNSNAAPRTSPDATTPAVVPTTPSIPSAPLTSSTPLAPEIDSITATKNLESARLAAAAKMGLDYTTAKTTASDAKTDYEQERTTSTPGSPELQQAGAHYLTAASDLASLEKKLASDPAVAAAEQVLKAAKSAGR